MDKLHVNSLSEFVGRINAIQTVWMEEGPVKGFFNPWFRGHANESYKLLPGLYRSEKHLGNEHSFREDFADKAYPFLADTAFGIPGGDWEWYFLMQHYGLPTRLLDWSEGSLIALYFALFYKSATDDSDACVWMMNPFSFNQALHQLSETFPFTHDILKEYLLPVWR